MCLKKYITKRAFTLVELMLYVSIAAIILLAISIFFGTILDSKNKNKVVTEVDQQGVRVMNLITQTMRNATAINSPAAGIVSASTSLNTPTGANNPTIFDIASGTIRIKEGAGAFIPLTNSRITASNLSFYNLTRATTMGNIQIKFTLTAVNFDNRYPFAYSKDFVSTASLR